MPDETTDEATLVKEILAQPESDALRLRYADWLQQTRSVANQARAELIRLQIDLSRITDDHPHWPAMIGRQRELLSTHRTTWERPLRQRCRPRSKSWRWLKSQLFGVGGAWGFRRGMVEHVLAPANRFLDEDIAMIEHSTVRRVAITQASAFIEMYTPQTILNKLDSLHFVGDMETDEELHQLVASAKRAGLHVVELRLPRLRDVFSDSETTDPVLLPNQAAHDHRAVQRLAQEAKDRLNTLLHQPALRILFDEPAPENTAAVLALSEWVFLGEQLKREGVWAVAMSYHDTPDEERRCRRLLLLREPPTANLLASPYFFAHLS